MKLKKILPFAHSLLREAVAEGDTVIDATVGNGHDTVVLAELVGDRGHVFGFDIQEQAIVNTTEKLKQANLLNRVTLIEASHGDLATHMPNTKQVTAAIFNLGYLPGGDKSIVTKPNSTINAIEQLLAFLVPEGIIVLVVYHGHEEGAKERDALLDFVKDIDQQKASVLCYQFLNQKNNAPFIIAIEKK
ncbi:methyltransferase domain-containing protein [Bacillus sp. HMF5848]|uniref:class I SAM-dependent methyltransferase n=1 Tax=Bacillus sp. HMF5848 TaxID=2495421 RepID=UPI000F7831B6|nr:class I SAM-dependent methyltransferase [Bacillus sp. HMF5848]RSK28247.1 methyltransferase domain-containing protein [Bacillus sp. HMF5848]